MDMEVRYNESTINRPEGDRVIDAPLVLVDIPSYIKQLKRERAWEENDRNSITVFKGDKLRIVLVAMHKKAEMHTDHPENVFSLQMIEGRIKLYTNEKTIKVGKDELFVIHENISYRIEAVKKAVFLLTVAE